MKQSFILSMIVALSVVMTACEKQYGIRGAEIVFETEEMVFQREGGAQENRIVGLQADQSLNTYADYVKYHIAEIVINDQSYVPSPPSDSFSAEGITVTVKDGKTVAVDVSASSEQRTFRVGIVGETPAPVTGSFRVVQR